MIRILKTAVACGAFFLSAQALAQQACTREGLAEAVENYIDAQENGQISRMHLSTFVSYAENMADAEIVGGIIDTPLEIDFHRSLLDVHNCETFTEVIVTDEAHPYVLGTRLRVRDSRVVDIEMLVTDQDDWLFSAENYLMYSAQEEWGVLAEEARSSRQTLIAAANAYFDLFREGPGTVDVPFGMPCNRLEGGLRTGEGTAEDSCVVGVPSGVDIVDRRFIVDEEIGAVVGVVRFGGYEGLPDSHLFRLENGLIRYIHTLTVCDEPNCGFDRPEQLSSR